MPVNTATAAVHITPVVIKTFLKHLNHKGRKLKEGGLAEDEATDDIFFDEAFHIVKAFIDLGTHNTIESLQAFTNTHVPSPWWAAVSAVKISLSCCNQAADILVDWFGPEDLKAIVGGERWWQVRGLDGVESEWITEKEFIEDAKFEDKPEYTEDERDILRMNTLDTVMLYVHGGAYFWGSVNTHRYQIIRYARKIKGRAFAVNYRKAPQYPWPCPLQDVLAAYLYLIKPPPGALHTPIPPSKIVLAGDSAGAGLCLAVLTVLRDMGVPLPAGAVLISPWIDLTHSFKSVMENTPTDIIPAYGFIQKPSALWPVHPLPEPGIGRVRVVPTQTSSPPMPGHADVLVSEDVRLGEQIEQQEAQRTEGNIQILQAEMPEKSTGHGDENPELAVLRQVEHINLSTEGSEIRQSTDLDAMLEFREPKPPKVLMKDPEERSWELCSQIQVYATNEQLTHPLVSPVLQGSLGNLCPLYIIAGDGEVLRDEIIYMAHKAANPSEYPAREGVLRYGHRQQENFEKFTTPTKVHLQVFDGMCHVLTVFTFTDSAKYAYRSIAEFVKHVTKHSEEHIARNPFPEMHIPPSIISEEPSDDERGSIPEKSEKVKVKHDLKINHLPPTGVDSQTTRSDVDLYRQNEETAKDEVLSGETYMTVDAEGSDHPESTKSGVSGQGDFPNIIMIRERVDIFGRVRPMEPKEKIQALSMRPQEIGLIKEAPVRRWLTGQEIWDKKYKRAAYSAIRRRQRYDKKSVVLLEHAREQGLHLHADAEPDISCSVVHVSTSSMGAIEQDKRWGPLDLENEQPPPSAIAGRRDTSESLALLKKSIYNTAPVTHMTVPKLKMSDAIKAAFDPEDHLVEPPRQSASEEQKSAQMFSVHGIRIWQSLVTYFMRKSTEKAEDDRRHATSVNTTTNEKVLETPEKNPTVLASEIK